MTIMHPIVDQFRDAANDAERARLLLTCPYSTLLECHLLFQHYCRKASFRPGEEYVDVTVAALHATRTPEGLSAPAIHNLVTEYTGRLVQSAVCEDDQPSPPGG